MKTQHAVASTCLLFTLVLTDTAAVRARAAEVPVPPAVSSAASRIVRSMPDLKNTRVAGFMPVYLPRSSEIVFYEAKVISASGTAAGSIMIAANGNVVQFTTRGPSKYEELRAKTQKPFKIVRFGPNYFTAEDESGKVLADFGTFPTVYADPFRPELLKARSSYNSQTDKQRPSKPHIGNDSFRRFASREAAYEDYVANYRKYFLRDVVRTPKPGGDLNDGPGPLFPVLNDPGSISTTELPTDPTGNPDSGGGGGSGQYSWYILGRQPGRWRQFRGDHPWNDKSWATGCGPTAMMNLLAWWDVNGAGDVLTGPNVTGTLDWDDWTKFQYTTAMRDQMGTFQSFFDWSAGATFPWDMVHGFEWIEKKTAYRVDEAWTYELPPPDEDALVLARRMIRYHGKPAIIGYLSDVHYDLAKGYWYLSPIEQFFRIAHDNGYEEWIEEDDLFYAGTIWDLQKKNNLLRNGGFELGTTAWVFRGEGAIATASGLSTGGTAHGVVGSPTGGGQAVFQNVLPPTSGVKWYLLTGRYRTTGSSYATIRLRKYYTSTTPGAVIQQWPLSQITDRFGVTMLMIPNIGSGFALEFATSGPSGSPNYLRLDQLELTAIY